MDFNLLKQLRVSTQASIKLCKQALLETNNNIEEAILWLRKKNMIRSAKSVDRIAGEKGVFVNYISQDHIILAVICVETDFVLRNDRLKSFITKELLADVDSISNVEDLRDKNADQIKEISGLLGEKIEILEFHSIKLNKVYGIYKHMSDNVLKSCAIVNAEVKWNGSENKDKLSVLLDDIAVHMTAIPSQGLNVEDIDVSFLEKEKEVFMHVNEQNMANKPDNIKEKMWLGKKNKIIEENILLKQKMIQDQTVSVEEYIAKFEKEFDCKVSITSVRLIK